MREVSLSAPHTGLSPAMREAFEQYVRQFLIFEVAGQIRAALADDLPMILSASVAAGKSQTVPIHGVLRGHSRIDLYVPTADGALGVAEYMVASLNETLRRNGADEQLEIGGFVGCTARGIRQVSERTVINISTYGSACSRELDLTRPLGKRLVLFDDFHSPGIDIDQVMAAVLLRRSRGEPISVGFMSATCPTMMLEEFLGGANVIQYNASNYPITVLPRGISEAHDTLRYLKQGMNVMLFDEGRKGCERMAHCLRVQSQAANLEAQVLTFHGGTSPVARRFIRDGNFDRPTAIVATDAAQQTLTVDVDVVIDPGVVKRTRLRNGRETLEREPISKAESEQRKGRVGRIRPGIYISYQSPALAAAATDQPVPDIQRGDALQAFLRFKLIGLDLNDSTTQLYRKPDAATLDVAKQQAVAMGFLKSNGELTRAGQRAARQPLDPKIDYYLTTVVRIAEERVRDPERLQSIRGAALTVAAIAWNEDLVAREAPGWQNLANPEIESDILVLYDIVCRTKAGCIPMGDFVASGLRVQGLDTLRRITEELGELYRIPLDYPKLSVHERAIFDDVFVLMGLVVPECPWRILLDGRPWKPTGSHATEVGWRQSFFEPPGPDSPLAAMPHPQVDRVRFGWLDPIDRCWRRQDIRSVVRHRADTVAAWCIDLERDTSTSYVAEVVIPFSGQTLQRLGDLIPKELRRQKYSVNWPDFTVQRETTIEQWKKTIGVYTDISDELPKVAEYVTSDLTRRTIAGRLTGVTAVDAVLRGNIEVLKRTRALISRAALSGMDSVRPWDEGAVRNFYAERLAGIKSVRELKTNPAVLSLPDTFVQDERLERLAPLQMEAGGRTFAVSYDAGSVPAIVLEQGDLDIVKTLRVDDFRHPGSPRVHFSVDTVIYLSFPDAISALGKLIPPVSSGSSVKRVSNADQLFGKCGLEVPQVERDVSGNFGAWVALDEDGTGTYRLFPTPQAAEEARAEFAKALVAKAVARWIDRNETPPADVNGQVVEREIGVDPLTGGSLLVFGTYTYVPETREEVWRWCSGKDAAERANALWKEIVAEGERAEISDAVSKKKKKITLRGGT